MYPISDVTREVTKDDPPGTRTQNLQLNFTFENAFPKADALSIEPAGL
jgi:hypothetical protein